MKLNQSRVIELGERLAEAGMTDRHRTQTRQEFETVYGISAPPTEAEIERVFKRTIQQRSQPLSKEQYEALTEQVDPNDILAANSREAAFDRLYETNQIGQKIANEFLRIAVDVLEVNPEWRDSLHVALDTNVVQALVKTGAIDVPSETDRSASRIVNMKPGSNPRKLVGYDAVQDAFATAAAEIGEAPIVFDELWTEHRAFINDPLLRDQSVFIEFLD